VRAKTKDEAERVGKYIVRPGKAHKRFFFLGPTWDTLMAALLPLRPHRSKIFSMDRRASIYHKKGSNP
jgi:hypothetical protein